MLVNLSAENSLVGEWVAEIRDIELQKDRMRFRRNLQRIGGIAAYEISRQLPYVEKEVQTPLGIATCKVLREQPVVATILRAGIPLHEGILDYFDRADNAFVAAYRKHRRDGSFDISMEYVTCPPLEGRILIMADPMLATGASLVKTLGRLLEEGRPSQIHVVTVIACTEGIEHVRRHINGIRFWAGAVDEELTAKGYIVPGLGDAGDLAFGDKKQQ